MPDVRDVLEIQEAKRGDRRRRVRRAILPVRGMAQRVVDRGKVMKWCDKIADY
jgi:hypothetical protein